MTSAKVTYIQTLDGEAKVEWWEKEHFQNRVTQIISPGEVVNIPIPDDVILCDFCNDRITEFPVPVVWGTHALCGECLKNTEKEGGEDHGR